MRQTDSHILLASKLFGDAHDLTFLKNQLEHQLTLPAIATENDLNELERLAKMSIDTKTGIPPQVKISFNGKILNLQEARLIVIQKAKAELQRRRGAH